MVLVCKFNPHRGSIFVLLAETQRYVFDVEHRKPEDDENGNEGDDDNISIGFGIGFGIGSDT